MFFIRRETGGPLEKILEWKSEDLVLSSYFTTKQFVIMSEIAFEIPHQL